MERETRTAHYTPPSAVQLETLLGNAIGVDAVRVSDMRHFVIADGEVVDIYAESSAQSGEAATEYTIEHCGSSNSTIDSDEDWNVFIDDLTTRLDNGYTKHGQR